MFVVGAVTFTVGVTVVTFTVGVGGLIAGAVVTPLITGVALIDLTLGFVGAKFALFNLAPIGLAAEFTLCNLKLAFALALPSARVLAEVETALGAAPPAPAHPGCGSGALVMVDLLSEFVPGEVNPALEDGCPPEPANPGCGSG